MNLIPNQPISLLKNVTSPTAVVPYGMDNSFTERTRFKTLFSPTQQMYIQWTLDGSARPGSATDVQIYNEDDVLVKDIGLWADQTENKNWFTIKFTWTGLGLPEGCYYIRWKQYPGAGGDTLQSATFNVTSNLDSCKLVTATADCYDLGFDWSVFALSWMVPFSRFNFDYDLTTRDYLDAENTNVKYYAERGKFWPVRTAAMDEAAHDCLTVMLLCDRVLIDGVEYYMSKKEYALPDLDKDGVVWESVGEFELRKQNDQPVNRNCKDCNEENYPYYG